MKPNPRLAALALLLTIIQFVPFARLHAEEAIPVDRVLPSNVSVFLSAPNIPDLKSRWAETMFGKLQADPALTEFWNEVGKQVEKEIAETEKELGVQLKDLANLPSGEVAFAVVQSPGKPMSIVFFMDYGDNQETLDVLLEKWHASLEEKGTEPQVKEIDDTRVTVFEFEGKVDEDADEVEPAKGHTLAYFAKDSFLVLGSGIPVLESILLRWDGQHAKTLANDEVYQYIRTKCSGESSKPILTWYLNPIEFARGLVTTFSGPDNMQANMAMGFLPGLGVMNFKAMGGTFDVATPEFDSISQTLLYVEQPTFGVLNLFHFPSVEQVPPKWVAEDVTAYFALNWDIGKAYRAVESMVDTFQGRGTFAKLIDQIGDADEGLKLHLKDDFIDQLTGRIHIVSDLPDPDDPNTERALMAMGVKDAGKMSAVLVKLTETPGAGTETRDFRGVKIYEVPVGLAEQTAAVAIAHGQLFMTNDVTILEQVVRDDSDRQSLVDADAYRKIAKHFPAKTSVLTYQTQDTQIKAAYELLRAGDFPGAGDVSVDFDFSTLPPFETIQKYLPPSGGYAVPDEKGVLFTGYSLKK